MYGYILTYSRLQSELTFELWVLNRCGLLISASAVSQCGNTRRRQRGNVPGRNGIAGVVPIRGEEGSVQTRGRDDRGCSDTSKRCQRVLHT